MIYYDIRDLYGEHLTSFELKVLMLVSNDLIKEFYFINHNKDLKNEITGELKKEHYHIIVGVDCDNRVARKKLESAFKPYTPFIKNVRSLNGAIRYLTHKDDLSKYQYNDSDVITNDIQKYNDLVVKEYKLSSCDNLLNEYYKFVFDKLCNGDVLTNGEILDFFSKKNKLNYYLLHRNNLISMYCDIKDSIYNFGVKNEASYSYIKRGCN